MGYVLERKDVLEGIKVSAEDCLAGLTVKECDLYGGIPTLDRGITRCKRCGNECDQQVKSGDEEVEIHLGGIFSSVEVRKI